MRGIVLEEEVGRGNNRSFMINIARELRANSTNAERALWQHLRGKKFLGLKFRRQHPIGNFITDFYCPAYKLVIEIDGTIHEEPDRRAADLEREIWLKANGCQILRLTNEIISKDIDSALQTIKQTVEKASPPLSAVYGERGRG